MSFFLVLLLIGEGRVGFRDFIDDFLPSSSVFGLSEGSCYSETSKDGYLISPSAR